MNYDQIKQLTEDSVTTVLDVGAHFGEFTKNMRRVLPYADYHMVEANAECEEHLKDVGFVPYTIALLSDASRTVSYYVNRQNKTSTGNSYYRELTHHFSDENLERVEIEAQTLDNLFPTQKFDLIKLDTQGSELDILRGGAQLVDRAKYVLLECSVEPYNEGAPLIDEVVDYMSKIGFEKQGVVEDHHFEDKLVQQDVLFKKQ